MQIQKVKFDNKKYQRFYIKSILKENDFKDIPTIYEKFEKETGFKLILTNHEISDIKSKYNEKYNKKNFLNLIENIKDENPELNFDIKSIDIKYEYNFKKNNIEKSEEREDKLIIFGTKESIKLLDYKNTGEFFVDTTFRIIPKKFKPYKMMTISSKNKNKDSVICCFIFYKNQDTISYERIFTFLRDNYNFYPKIIHHDYESALYKSFDNQKIFENKVIHVFCHFHYIKAILDKMIKLKITKRKINKKAFLILKNIQIISFIKKENLKKYIEFITKKLMSLKVDSKFISYMNKNWFTHNEVLFNYNNLFDLIEQSGKDKEAILDNFFFTNNIAEALHRKINYYLPKNATSPENFANSLVKIFINNLVRHKTIKRNDFKTRAIINIISDLNLNEEPKWIENKIFKEYEINTIKNNNITYNENDVLQYFNLINDDLDEDVFEASIQKENIDEDDEIINNNINDKKNNLEIDSDIKDNISEDGSENNNLFEIQDNFLKDNTSNAYKALIKNIDSLDIEDDFSENNIIETDKNKVLKLEDLMSKKPRKRKHDSSSVSKEKKKSKSRGKKKKYPFI